MKKFVKVACVVLPALMLGFTPDKEATLSKEDQAIERKVDSLLKLMTLEEKLGQLNIVVGEVNTGPSANPNAREKFVDDIKKGKVTGLFNTYGAELLKSWQKTAVEESRLKIPLLFGADVIHGFRTIFPIPLAESASWDMDAIRKGSAVAAAEASAVGINWTYAPMVDIARDPRWGRMAEGAGEDTYLGSKIAVARVEGFQGKNLKQPNTIAACAKHFLAYGAAESGRDYNTVDMSERVMREVYLPPFKAAIDAGVASIMSSFNEIDGIPASGNSHIMNDILRKEWGYKGFVVSDYNSIGEMIAHGAAANLTEAAEMAMNATVDMDMMGFAYISQIPKLLEAGKIKEAQVNDAVKRVLRVKYKLGLFSNPYLYTDVNREKKEILSKENRAAARDMARKSIVLLKNKMNILPLKKDVKTIAVIGPLADNKAELNGMWAFFGDPKDPVTLLEGIKAKVPSAKILYAKGCNVDDSVKTMFAEAVNAAKQADVVILNVGENAIMTGESASKSDINLPGVQNDLVREIAKTGKPIVVVLTNGRPLTINWIDENIPSIVESWCLGTETGNALADVLFGDYNPSGKLPVTFPRSVGQIPLYYNHKNTGRPANEKKKFNGVDRPYDSRYLDVPNSPLYPFGYGLSYTTFEYGEVNVDKSTITSKDTLTVTIDVKNTGKYDGEEVVQLYIRDMVGSTTRPVKELKGFQKLMFKAGESKKITFKITENELKFLRKDMTWGTEPGKFKVFVGTNSEETQVAAFTLQ